MHICIIWNVWGLPFGFSKGKLYDDWSFAFSLGPVHFVKYRDDKL